MPKSLDPPKREIPTVLPFKSETLLYLRRRHNVKRHDVGHTADRDQVSALKPRVDDDLAICARECHFACKGGLRDRRRAQHENQIDIESFLFEEAGIVHNPKWRINGAHGRPRRNEFLRFQRGHIGKQQKH